MRMTEIRSRGSRSRGDTPEGSNLFRRLGPSSAVLRSFCSERLCRYGNRDRFVDQRFEVLA
jgi:hypothetical protein